MAAERRAGGPTAAAGAGSPGRSPRRALVGLCTTQITSWGVLYYAFPVALAAITADTGWSATTATAAFSAGLVVSALAGIPVGRWLDVFGPRRVMTAGSVLAVPATVAIALAPNYATFLAAWLVAGAAMSAVFYQAAFAALTRWYGDRRVRALTTLTLVAGLASTVFAPLTHALVEALGWRGAYLVLAGVLAVVTIPVHATTLTAPWTREDHRGRTPGRSGSGVPAEVRSGQFLALSAALTLTAFGLYAASLTVIPLLTGRGFSASLAATTFGLLGAGQLLGRLVYGPLSARTTPTGRTVGLIGAGALTIGLLAILSSPPAALVAAAVALGAVRGACTLLQATAVADRWGTARYGTLSGFFAAPVTAATALAPWAGTALAEALGSHAAAFGLLAAGVVAAAVLAWRGGRPAAV
ncbi:MFS family permease [Geodermatophilus bullaregiensis]|uniref:MFS transporter n=1 Tax=Geodermatophilus bullaregiensis TaxID=1564160 RepID=UPI0019564279|nr:MFS transporter [Geodermatophilus bullaregiensis]MBM7805638.1 MFS family permease [Geodermatophilus bullaregiensis]